MLKDLTDKEEYILNKFCIHNLNNIFEMEAMFTLLLTPFNDPNFTNEEEVDIAVKLVIDRINYSYFVEDPSISKYKFNFSSNYSDTLSYLARFKDYNENRYKFIINKILDLMYDEYNNFLKEKDDYEESIEDFAIQVYNTVQLNIDYAPMVNSDEHSELSMYTIEALYNKLNSSTEGKKALFDMLLEEDDFKNLAKFLK